MCLEDRLLMALYDQQGPISLPELSSSIYITPNAGLSIVHRVFTTYPAYIVVEKEGPAHDLLVSPNPALALEVQQFIQDGGFTAINEKEFRQYYATELKKEKIREFFRKLTSGQMLKRWLTGTGITMAGGLALAAWAKTRKR